MQLKYKLSGKMVAAAKFKLLNMIYEGREKLDEISPEASVNPDELLLRVPTESQQDLSNQICAIIASQIDAELPELTKEERAEMSKTVAQDFLKQCPALSPEFVHAFKKNPMKFKKRN